MRPGTARDSSRRRRHSGSSIGGATDRPWRSGTGLPVSDRDLAVEHPVGVAPASPLRPGRAGSLAESMTSTSRRRAPRAGVGAASGGRQARRRPGSVGSRAPPARRPGPASATGAAPIDRLRAAPAGRARRRRRSEPDAGRVTTRFWTCRIAERLADGGAADVQLLRELALTGEPVARQQAAGGDLLHEMVGDLLVALTNETGWREGHTGEQIGLEYEPIATVAVRAPAAQAGYQPRGGETTPRGCGRRGPAR